MIRHIVLMRFKDDVTAEDIDRIDAGLAELPSKIEEIQTYTNGRNLGITEGAWDYAVVVDFTDVDAYRRYHSHPDHVKVIDELTGPATAELKRLQFEIR